MDVTIVIIFQSFFLPETGGVNTIRKVLYSYMHCENLLYPYRHLKSPDSKTAIFKKYSFGLFNNSFGIHIQTHEK